MEVMMLKFPKNINTHTKSILSKFQKMEIKTHLKEKITPCKMGEMVLSVASNRLLLSCKLIHSNVNDKYEFSM